MTLYTVLAPPTPADTTPDPVRLVFVKEGFCWPALLFPIIWLIFRRMWLVLALYVALGVGLIVLARNVDAGIPITLYVLLRLLFAIEGNGLRRFTLEGAGYHLIDLVEGRRLIEAELRYFHSRPIEESPVPPTATLLRPREPNPTDGQIVGLFPAPGG